MVKRQQELNIHLIPCQKIRDRFQMVTKSHLDQNLTQVEFCAVLANCKLLKADYPRTDQRWKRFYSKFVVTEEDQLE